MSFFCSSSGSITAVLVGFKFNFSPGILSSGILSVERGDWAKTLSLK